MCRWRLEADCSVKANRQQKELPWVGVSKKLLQLCPLQGPMRSGQDLVCNLWTGKLQRTKENLTMRQRQNGFEAKKFSCLSKRFPSHISFLYFTLFTGISTVRQHQLHIPSSAAR